MREKWKCALLSLWKKMKEYAFVVFVIINLDLLNCWAINSHYNLVIYCQLSTMRRHMHRHQPVKSSQSTSLNMLHQRVQIGQPLFDLSVRVASFSFSRSFYNKMMHNVCLCLIKHFQNFQYQNCAASNISIIPTIYFLQLTSRVTATIFACSSRSRTNFSRRSISRSSAASTGSGGSSTFMFAWIVHS